MTALDRGAEFLWTHARLVERCEFQHAFRGGPLDAVVRAVAAYSNADGGLGHALEPDLRTPDSQPLFVFSGFGILGDCGATVADPAVAALAARACAFLATVATPEGSVPWALSSAAEHARAGHWNGPFAFAPSLVATAGVAGVLHAVGARHEWLDLATTWCFAEIEGRPRYSGHTILNVLEFLRAMPDRDRAARLWPHVTSRLFEADYVAMETPQTTYGLTPLRFARSPAHPARALFTDGDIERHLDHLASLQQDDGGWPLTWTPPAGAAVAEWRGRWTLDALWVLRAYGRI